MTEYEELDAKLRAWLDEDQVYAECAARATAGYNGDAAQTWWHYPSHLRWPSPNPHAIDPARADYQEHFSPAAVLADIAGKRALLDQLARWQHEYAEDSWYSCGLAIEPQEEDAEPGSGCANEANEGRCTCYLDARRLAVLRCVAAGYASRPEFRTSWSLNG